MPVSEMLTDIVAWLMMGMPIILAYAFYPAHGLSDAQQDISDQESSGYPACMDILFFALILCGLGSFLPLNVTGNRYERRVTMEADARRAALIDYRQTWDPRYR